MMLYRSARSSIMVGTMFCFYVRNMEEIWREHEGNIRSKSSVLACMHSQAPGRGPKAPLRPHDPPQDCPRLPLPRPGAQQGAVQGGQGHQRMRQQLGIKSEPMCF